MPGWNAPLAAQVSAPPASTPDEAQVGPDGLPDTTGVSDLLPGPSDVAEFEAWLDGYLGSMMSTERIAGTTVSVVRDGALWFSKGYGFANVDADTPVDPSRTLFRIGSVSKLFVWTAVMQLVERGQLDLDADVNTYLSGVEIPGTYPEPVTLGDIMAHAAGFEDHVLGLFGDEVEDLRPLAEILSEQMPTRVRPPGVLSAYSNHATGMAMLVVEQVSGVPWEQYIQENIVGPLGMEQFTFTQPVPESLADDLSQGYSWGGGAFQEKPFEFVPLAPVGAASASAEAMARFMIAHLELGQGPVLAGASAQDSANARIMSESTALDMQSPILRHGAGMNAMLHGFAEYTRNGTFAYGHGGDTEWFHTILVLIPQAELGVFISMNSEAGRPAPVVNALFERYFPAEEWTAPEPTPGFAERVEGLVGSYRSARYAHDDVTKVAVLAGVVDVRDGGDGSLRLSSRGDTRWVEVAPHTFRDADGVEEIAFAVDGTGKGLNLFYSGVPYIGFERVPATEQPSLHLWLLVSCLLALAVTFLSWPLVGFFRRRFGADPPEPRISGGGRLVLWLGCLAFLVFALFLAVVLSNPSALAFGETGLLRTALWFPIIGLGLMGCALVYAVPMWISRHGTLVGRVSFTVVALCGVLLAWQLWVFNLLGWNL